ncbi:MULTISPECIES: hypothetical protein [Cysteiniphilum]|uniref:hypothetical protein n=1 Tax=Cysteiniphilum TaxID=2056696 RepID=UPI001785A243|nr:MULTISPECIES: hypothetical protein [Cysteiniphilum]
MQNTTIINAVKSFVNGYTNVFKNRFAMEDNHNFEQVLAGTEKKMEAQLMLDAGVPLSIIAKTLDMKISDILGR